MTETSGRSEATDGAMLLNRAAEVMIRLAILGAIVVWCFNIFSPFLIPILWAAIISVALFPLYAKLKKLVGGRDGIAGTLFVLVALAVIIVPSIGLAGSIADTAQELGQQIESDTLQVPPPRESVRTWPLIGDRLYETWLAASENLQATMERFAPQVHELASRAVHSLRGIAGALLQTILAIIIASFFLAKAEAVCKAMRTLSRRLAGERGDELLGVMRGTIRSIAQGVLGIAFIQALAGGLGMVFADVPAAGVWALLILILAIMQLPPLIVLGPVIVYVFSANDSTTVAVIFAIWGVLVSISDAFLKPLLLGRGVSTPMPVILIGAIGGMVVYGVIGLFLGAVVLAIGWDLYRGWLLEGQDPVEAISRSSIPKPDPT